MKLTGAQIVIKTLIEEGVDKVFGYPGGTALPLYDELFKNQDKITNILPSHEQSAAHAADAYARTTGKVGVCLATSGPGSTNLVTGIATAHMDSSPIVAITSNVPLTMIGRDSFQEVDIVGITIGITKYNYFVKDAKYLAKIVKKAFQIANSGRKGAVLIDIPKNISLQEVEYQAPEITPFENPHPQPSEIEEVARKIDQSQKPYVYFGGGVNNPQGSKALNKFLQKINSPATSSLMGLGAINPDYPYYTGLVGMHGTKFTNVAIQQSDLVVAVGARFSDRVTSSPDKFLQKPEVIHIDIDPSEIDKNVITTTNLVGDAGKILQELTKLVQPKQNQEWNQKILALKEKYDLDQCLPTNEKLTPKAIIKKMSQTAKRGTIVTTDVGQHQLWTAQNYRFDAPRQFITSGGLGTMGFGLGAAIGAQKAFPEKMVILVTGDGSFRMNLSELSTVSAYNLPIKIVLIDNGTLGMVRQWQTLFFDKRYSATTLDRGPHWDKLAQAYDLDYFHLSKGKDLDATMQKFLSCPRATLLHCRVDIDECVYPIVPPGKAIEDAVTK